MNTDKSGTHQQDLYCPICGKFNRGRDVFKCPECEMDLICPSHRDSWLMVCSECSRMIRTEEFERISIKLFKEIPPGMVFISPGNFILGSDEGESNCSPAYYVHLKGYYIDENPVTNSEFKGLIPEHEFPAGFENEPVRGVSWIDAKKYATLAGKRLPTELEWEKAMRGVDGLVYPWGNDLPDGTDVSQQEYSARISSLARSQFGVNGGCGGLMEWVEDWYQPYPGNKHNDPAFGTSHKVLRGGNWSIYHPVTVVDRRYALPDEKNDDVGFRCVKDTSLLFDYDISETREFEQRRVKRIVEQLEMEKAARKLTKDRDSLIRHDKRIIELEDRLREIEEENLKKLQKQQEPTSVRKIVYLFSSFWESLINVSGSKSDTALRWLYLCIAVIIIFLFFSNIAIKEKIIFSVQRNVEGKEIQYIAITDTNGNSLNVLEDLGEATQPAFSPNGKHIAFVREIDGNKEVFIANASGKNHVNISNDPGNDFQPKFTHGGKIVWVSERGGSKDLYISKIDGSDAKLVPLPAGELGAYDFSPNDSSVVFALKLSKNWEIYTMKVGGEDVTRISDENSNCVNPIFTSRGKRILYASDTDGNYELYYMGWDGAKPVRVTYTIENEIEPFSFSSNGKWLFSHAEYGIKNDPPSEIYKMRWDGKARRSIVSDERIIGSSSTGLMGFKRFFAGIFNPSYHPRDKKWKYNLNVKSIKDPILESRTLWFRTGISISKDDFIDLMGQGTWRCGKAADGWINPDGKPGSENPDATLPEYPIGMLIARIGDSQPFPVGKHQSFISDMEGELKLMMNDDGILSDNEGSISVKIDVLSNNEIAVKVPPSFSHLKYFGFDDGRNTGIPPEKYTGNARINLTFLSLADAHDPAAIILNGIGNGRAVLIEPSNLYYLNPNFLDKSIKSFIESFGEEPLPRLAFFIPFKLPGDATSSVREIMSALKRNFPYSPIISRISNEQLISKDLDIDYCNKFDCLIIELPQSINASGKETSADVLSSHLQVPIDHALFVMPEMPLMMEIPLGETSDNLTLSPTRVEKIVRFYDVIPQVVGVVLSGTGIDDDMKLKIAQLSDEITQRKAPINAARKMAKNMNPLEVSNVPIGGDKPYTGNFKGLVSNSDDFTYTTDSLNNRILKIAPDGNIAAQTHATLPQGIILDEITGLYIDRNDRIILHDSHPGYIVYFDESLEYADLIKLPGEKPGGIAGIKALARNSEDQIFTISDDGDLLQKFDKDFSLMKWTGGTSLRPGYFLTPNDIAIGPRKFIYVVDKSKRYFQKYNFELELEAIIPLPGKDTFFNPVPLFITVDKAGSVYVAEKRSRNVYHYSPTGDLVSYFELPAVPTGGIEITPNGLFRTIMNGKIVSYDLNKTTPPPELEEEPTQM